MPDCHQSKNKAACNCTYEPCPRKGLCCECIAYHRRAQQLPACYFPSQVEKTYDRSIENFIKCYKR